MLPAPNLDDRRFQDLVDDAKRLVQQRCPEWTDHNVSDPGVTLIETFAFMVDQLLYRLNRVPDRHYLKFLDLIGVQPFAPTAACVDVTFWLSAPRETVVTVPAGSQVATVRTEAEEPVAFQTVREASIVPTSLARLMVERGGDPAGAATPVDRTDELTGGEWLDCFSTRPVPGDGVLFGLRDPVPGCAVLLRLTCTVAGVGVDPRDPPLVWQAWTGGDWTDCEVERDTTGGLNREGEVVLHVPDGHTASVLARRRAGWLRCRVLEPAAGQPFYRASPRIQAATAATIGAAVPAVHAELVTEEILGLSEGVPGQRFRVQRPPIVAGDPPVVVEVAGVEVAGGKMAGGKMAGGEVAGGDGWTEWRDVTTFADSSEDDRHVLVDRGSGEISFGPAVRQPDGTLRRYGAVPPKAAPIRVRAYRTGGGRRGNVARDTLTVLRDPVPFVSGVSNRRAATGGVDGESVSDAAVRGPLSLRTRERAVTADDYEQLARQAAPEAARVRCVPSDEASTAVRVLVVPAIGGTDPAADDGRRFASLQPPEDMLRRIAECLDERRCVGARVLVEPPFYQGVTVVAQVRARGRAAAVRDAAVRALYGYLDPVSGGPDGGGWPFGRPIQSGEVFAVLQRLPGVDMVEDVRLFGADPVTGERGEPVQRLELSSNALVFSYGHQVRIIQ